MNAALLYPFILVAGGPQAAGNPMNARLRVGLLDAERVARFGRLMCERMDEGEVGARRAYIVAVVSRIEVHDEVVRIVGERETLHDAVFGASGQMHVSGFVRKWRAP